MTGGRVRGSSRDLFSFLELCCDDLLQVPYSFGTQISAAGLLCKCSDFKGELQWEFDLQAAEPGFYMTMICLYVQNNYRANCCLEIKNPESDSDVALKRSCFLQNTSLPVKPECKNMTIKQTSAVIGQLNQLFLRPRL